VLRLHIGRRTRSGSRVRPDRHPQSAADAKGSRSFFPFLFLDALVSAVPIRATPCREVIQPPSWQLRKWTRLAERRVAASRDRRAREPEDSRRGADPRPHPRRLDTYLLVPPNGTRTTCSNAAPRGAPTSASRCWPIARTFAAERTGNVKG
jgi:hypothetical protein